MKTGLLQARRDEVLLAAREAFASQGYEAAGIRDIAARLGILSGSLYYYIDSKQALLFELMAGAQGPGLDEVTSAAATEGTAPERLRRTMRAHARRVGIDPIGGILVLQELAALSDEQRSEILKGVREYRDVIEGLVIAGQADGTLRADWEPRLATMAVLGALNWMLRWYSSDGPVGAELVGDQIADVLLDGLAVAGAWAAPAAIAVPAHFPAGSGRREELLTAAAALFHARGFEATTTNDIADAMRLHKSSLYHYMHGKQELLFRVMVAVQRPSLDVVTEMAASGCEPLSTLAAAIDFHIRYLLVNLERTSLVLHQVRALPKDLQATVTELGSQYTAAFETMVVAGQRAGVLRAELDPGIAARAILGVANWPYRWFKPGGPWSPEHVAAALSAQLVSGLKR